MARLERYGLVERRHEQQDRRVVKVYLTEEGRDILRFLPGAVEAFYYDLIQGIAEEELQAVKGVLHHLAEVGIPLIISSTSEQEIGPTLRDIQELAPQQYANRIKRGPVFNAFLVDEFRQAVEATGRKNLILAALTTDVCAFNSSIGARRLGYEVQLVADACGSPSALVADFTFARLRENGVVVTGGNQLLMTLFTAFDTPVAKKAEQIGFQELISGYGS